MGSRPSGKSGQSFFVGTIARNPTCLAQNCEKSSNVPFDFRSNVPFDFILVQKLQSRPYTPLIKQIYGADVFTKYTPRQIFEICGEAIAAFEASGDVCQFSSKYDASK